MKNLMITTIAAISVLFLGACGDKDDCDSAVEDADCVADDDDTGDDGDSAE